MTSDPCGEWLIALCLVILYDLDRAGDGIRVQPFLCGGSGGRGRCWGPVIGLTGVGARVAGLRASHLPERTILLGGVSCRHARLRWGLLQGPGGAWGALWSWRQVVGLCHGRRRHLGSGRGGT